MAILKKPDIQLVGLKLSETELYDGLPVLEGNHLRWTFNPEMGFPKDGFTISRFTQAPQDLVLSHLSVNQPFDPETWTTHINLPSSHEEAMERIRIGSDGDELVNRFNEGGVELLQLVEQLRDPTSSEHMYDRYVSGAESASLKSGVKVMDALLLASVDPYIARMLGVYIVDRYADPSQKYYYRVTGHWGDLTFPLVSIDFENVTTIQKHQTLQFKEVKIISGRRTIGVPSLDGNDLYHKHLFVKGDLNPAFKVHVTHDIEELIIAFDLMNRSGSWGIRLDGEVFSGVEIDGELRIQRPGNPFKRIEFFNVPGNDLRIYKVQYRKRMGEISDVSSVMGLNQNPDPVPTPLVSQLRNEQIPAILDENGTIQNKISQVNISSLVQTPRIEEVDVADGGMSLPLLETVTQINYPVRMQFGRSVGRGTPETMLNYRNGIFSPVLYRESTDDSILPSLLGYWSFDGYLENEKDGALPTKLGNPRFVKDFMDEGVPRYSLLLNGNDGIELTDQSHLKALGDQFTLEVTLNISAQNDGVSTLIGNNYTSGFWLGLIEQSDGNFKPRLWIKNRVFNATGSIPSETWTRLIVSYNGEQVFFHYQSPTYSIPEEAQPAELGKIDIPGGNIVIGAENGSTEDRMRMPFTGMLADVCIWQRSIHPLESESQRNKWKHFLKDQRSVAEMVFRDRKLYVVSTRRDQVLIDKTSELKALSHSFSIFLWAFAGESNATYTTLLGNNYRESFWIGLSKSGTDYAVRVWLNGARIQSSRRFSANEWAHIGVSYDGSQIQIYLNGELESTHPASLGALNNNDLPIAIGSDSGATSVSNQYRFNGLIQDIQFWRKSISIFEWQSKVGAVQQVDRFLPNGRYRYFVQGIDLFGRTSEWSDHKVIKTKSIPKYNAPLNVHSQFKPLLGAITESSEMFDEEGIKLGYELMTNIEYNADLATKMLGYDLTVSREIMREVPLGPDHPDFDAAGTERVPTFVKQLLEIGEAQEHELDGRQVFRLFVKAVPFEQLVPQSGDVLMIQLDFFYTMTWSWTGIQQLYFPEITKFRLFKLIGHLNEISGDIRVLETLAENRFRIQLRNSLNLRENELSGQKCLIGPNMFTIDSHSVGRNPEFEVRYSGFPRITPVDNDLLKINLSDRASTFKDYDRRNNWRFDRIEIPAELDGPYEASNSQAVEVLDMEKVTEEELAGTTSSINLDIRRRLISEQVDWIPPSRVYQITFPNFLRPDGYESMEPKVYVPGALVFYDETPGKGRWRSFYVLWHSWGTDNRLVMYVTPGEIDEPLPVVHISESHTVRFYEGKRYICEGNIKRAPNFPSGVSTIPYHLALVSADDSRVQSEISRRATMVATNRRRPRTARKPRAEIQQKADYYQKCKVEVSWAHPGGERVRYKLFRANDSAIYTRDLEQRRTRQGYYKGTSATSVFEDDVDFNDWLSSTYPLASVETLFAESGSTSWNEATPIWRAWADRFYPSLTDEELSSVAERAGNEKAFALITGKPISERRYTDEINGMVSNRYYYRLRLMNTALAESTEWGPISDPIIPPAVLKPRKPVFTKIEAGDRQITLNWSLNRERDLKEYKLYRSETREELEDLRWWSLDDDPRIIATIPDPRIVVKDRSVSIPGSVEITEILGVFTTDKFDSTQEPVDRQSALNYWNLSPIGGEAVSLFIPAASENGEHTIENLRRIANGVAVAIAYRNAVGEVQVISQVHAQIPYVDEGLEGLKDYYYRLVALNDKGIEASSKEIKKGTPVEIAPPLPIEIIETSWQPADGRLGLNISWEPLEGYEVQILRRNTNNNQWKIVGDWMDASSGRFYERMSEPHYNNQIVCKTRRLNGIVTSESIIAEIEAYLV